MISSILKRRRVRALAKALALQMRTSIEGEPLTETDKDELVMEVTVCSTEFLGRTMEFSLHWTTVELLAMNFIDHSSSNLLDCL